MSKPLYTDMAYCSAERMVLHFFGFRKRPLWFYSRERRPNRSHFKSLLTGDLTVLQKLGSLMCHETRRRIGEVRWQGSHDGWYLIIITVFKPLVKNGPCRVHFLWQVHYKRNNLAYYLHPLAIISISFDSRGKHCDTVVGVFIESCQICLSYWSIHYYSSSESKWVV